jgi:hypothetical protein
LYFSGCLTDMPYRDKKVVGVFIAFSCTSTSLEVVRTRLLLNRM